jgi:hypothetical protein
MDILAALKQEESKLQQQLSAVQRAIAALSGAKSTALRNRSGRKRVMSAAAKAKMSKAAKERWAKIKAEKKGKKSA